MNKPFFASLALAALLGLSPPTFARPTEISAAVTVAQATAAEISVVGPLQLGMEQEAARGVLGTPETETEAALVPATGSYSKQWLYPSKGVGLTLSSERPQGPYAIETIMLEEPSTYQVAAGICIGMLETEAYNRFKTLLTEDINSFEVDEDKFGVTINSTYQVLVVGCSDGLVKHIYLGPGPE